jgi:hypothetical protein
MKKLILLLAFAGFLSSSYAQNLMLSEVPAVVTKAFHKTHPKTDSVQWSKVSDSYKASYNVKMQATAVTYSEAGKLMGTEKEIKLSDLPAPALEYVNANYKGGPIKKSLVLTTPVGKSSYIVKLKDVDLAFDSKGKFVK